MMNFARVFALFLPLFLLPPNAMQVQGLEAPGDAYDHVKNEFVPQGIRWMEVGFFLIYQDVWTAVETSYTNFSDPVVFLSLPNIPGSGDTSTTGKPAALRVNNTKLTYISHDNKNYTFDAKMTSVNDTYCTRVNIDYTPSELVLGSSLIGWMVIERGMFNVSHKAFIIQTDVINRTNVNDSTDKYNQFKSFAPRKICNFGKNCALNNNQGLTIGQLQTTRFDRFLLLRAIGAGRRFVVYVLTPHDSLTPGGFFIPSPGEDYAWMLFEANLDVACIENLVIETYRREVTFIKSTVPFQNTFEMNPAVFGMVMSLTGRDSLGLRTINLNTTQAKFITQEDKCTDEETDHTETETAALLIIGRAGLGTTVCGVTFNDNEETPFPSTAPSSAVPTTSPTSFPTSEPSSQPSGKPSGQPSAQPIGHPSGKPSGQPSGLPSGQPSLQPSGKPSGQPSGLPSGQPSLHPSGKPSGQPSGLPSGQPSLQPSSMPTPRPTVTPTAIPIGMSACPTVSPTALPSGQPSEQPSGHPSGRPSGSPSGQPSEQPNAQPSGRPTVRPSGMPSQQPSGKPSGKPFTQPSGHPSSQPSARPSGEPSGQPSAQPLCRPTGRPSGMPVAQPTGEPSSVPTAKPSLSPTSLPSLAPTTANPTVGPTSAPSNRPSIAPSARPSIVPSSRPTRVPVTQSPTYDGIEYCILVTLFDTFGDGWGNDVALNVWSDNVDRPPTYLYYTSPDQYEATELCVYDFETVHLHVVAMNSPAREKWEIYWTAEWYWRVPNANHSLFVGDYDTNMTFTLLTVHIDQPVEYQNQTCSRCEHPPPKPKPPAKKSPSSPRHVAGGSSSSDSDSSTESADSSNTNRQLHDSSSSDSSNSSASSDSSGSSVSNREHAPKPKPLWPFPVTLFDTEGNGWFNYSESWTMVPYYGDSGRVSWPVNRFLPQVLTNPEYVIETIDRLHDIRRNTICGDLLKEDCEERLPDAKYIFRVTGALSKWDTMDNSFWHFCGKHGTVMEELEFKLIHGKCFPGQKVSAQDTVMMASFSGKLTVSTSVSVVNTEDNSLDLSQFDTALLEEDIAETFSGRLLDINGAVSLDSWVWVPGSAAGGLDLEISYSLKFDPARYGFSAVHYDALETLATELSDIATATDSTDFVSHISTGIAGLPMELQAEDRLSGIAGATFSEVVYVGTEVRHKFDIPTQFQGKPAMIAAVNSPVQTSMESPPVLQSFERSMVIVGVVACGALVVLYASVQAHTQINNMRYGNLELLADDSDRSYTSNSIDVSEQREISAVEAEVYISDEIPPNWN